jgi:hypothetical protein
MSRDEHERRRPPNRRPLVTRAVVWTDPVSLGEQRLFVSVGFDPAGGGLIEVFANLARPGSLLGTILAEACISISHELQCGRRPADLAPRYGVSRDGMAATPLGAVMAVLVSEADQMTGA